MPRPLSDNVPVWRTVKFSVSMPGPLVAKVNRHCSERYVCRSEFFRKAMEMAIEADRRHEYAQIREVLPPPAVAKRDQVNNTRTPARTQSRKYAHG